MTLMTPQPINRLLLFLTISTITACGTGTVENATPATLSEPSNTEVTKLGTTPVTNPNTPVTNPNTPVTNPNTPVTNPNTPVTNPNTPVTNPNTPVTNPNTPVTNPNTPVTNPNTPATNPNTPVTNPNTPVTNPNTPATPGQSTQWLHTSGNHIYRQDNTIWAGHGAVVHDTRSCDVCTAMQPNVQTVINQIDAVVDTWHGNLIRLMLENYQQANGRVQWKDVLQDPNYLNDIITIVDHIGTKKNIYVMLTLFGNPGYDSHGLPTATTNAQMQKLATVFKNYSYVIYAVSNEPYNNGTQLSTAYTAMVAGVSAIRQAEDAVQSQHHLISVQGLDGWSRYLNYYIDHPISIGNGENIIYESHPYNSQGDFAAVFGNAAQTLPVIIGEFGPLYMTNNDITALMSLCEKNNTPYTAWTFHPNCGPLAMIQNNGGNICSPDYPLTPDAWGTFYLDHLLGLPSP